MDGDNHLKSVCRIGGGSECCRYLMGSPERFECAKVNGWRSVIDGRAAKINAKGDNCPGMFEITQ